MPELRKRTSEAHFTSPRRVKKVRLNPGFRYHALDPLRMQIRLLEILPGKPGSRIRARMLTTSLHDNVEYEALSYMWGPSYPSYEITIDSYKRFQVGRNLRKALDDLRYEHAKRLVWTDAICINQSDQIEKGHQVALMRQIYSKAQRVCAWIDQIVNPAMPVFEDLQRLGKGVELEDFLEPEHWHPVADIFRDPYWRRLWIQQELMLAKRIAVYCRRQVFDGHQLLRFQFRLASIRTTNIHIKSPRLHLKTYIEVVVKPGETPIEALSRRVMSYEECVDDIVELWKSPESITPERITELCLLREAFRKLPATPYSSIVDARNYLLGKLASENRRGKTTSEGQNLDLPYGSLLNIFLSSKSLNVTEAKDRVYGMLGIATDIDGSSIKVDYTLSTKQVYCQVFQSFLKQYHSLAFLCSSKGYWHENAFGDDFPTWFSDDIFYAAAEASRACGALQTAYADIDSSTGVLSAQGILVDRVTFIGDTRLIVFSPISYMLSKVEEYCHMAWQQKRAPDACWKEDDVVSLLLGRMLPKRYRKMFGIDMPDATELYDTIQKLRSYQVSAPSPYCSLDGMWGAGELLDGKFSGRERQICTILDYQLDYKGFIGTANRRLGMMGSGSQVRTGDQVWILFGCSMPIVLRPVVGRFNYFTVVAAAELPGLMDGEAVEGIKCEQDVEDIPGRRVERVYLI